MNGFRLTILVAVLVVLVPIMTGNEDLAMFGWVLGYLFAAVCFVLIVIRSIWRLASRTRAAHIRTLLVDWCCWLAFALPMAWIILTVGIPGPFAREAARRIQCHNNLKNIMVAMNSYSAKYGCYPPAYTVDKQGRRMHSWRALLLEFLDRELYAQYDFSHPWNSPGNLAVAEKMGGQSPYRCPTELVDYPKITLNTSYVMLVGPNAFSDGPTGRKQEEIIDGSANTIAVVEMSPSGIFWTAPYDLNTAEMSFKINDPDQAGVRSCHYNGAVVLFADGRVDFLSNNTPDVEKYLKAAATINGGEDSKFPL